MTVDPIGVGAPWRGRRMGALPAASIGSRRCWAIPIPASGRTWPWHSSMHPTPRRWQPLALDPDEMVRAALFVTRLLRGRVAASRRRRCGLPRSAGGDGGASRPFRWTRSGKWPAAIATQARRLSAALALAVLDDEAAYSVMRSDPIWAVRDRVGRMLASWRDPPDARHSA